MQRIAWPMIHAAAACVAAIVLGFVVVLFRDASPVWLVLLLFAGAAGVAVGWSNDAIHALLYVFVFSAPIAITKSIASVDQGGVYPSSLELWLADIPLVMLCVAWLVDAVLHKKPLWPPAWWTVLLVPVCVWAWISGATSDNLGAGVFGAVNQTKFLLQFVLLQSLVNTPRILRRVLAAAGAGLALNLLMVAAQVAAGSPLAIPGVKASAGMQIYAAIEGMQTFRPSGFLLHPNPFAAYLVMTIPVPFVLVLVGRRAVSAGVWWCCLGFAAAGGVALLLTLSRGGWISFAVAATFAIAIAMRRGLVPKRRVAAMCGLAVVGLGLVLVMNPTIVYRVTRGDRRSTETRVVMMEQAALVIRAHPILGVGLGNYPDAAERHRPSSFARLSPDFTRVLRRWLVHNGFLLMWSEQGIVGLALHVAILVAILIRFRLTREWWDPALHGVAVGLVAGLVGQYTFYLFDHFFLDLRPGVLWVLLGLVAAALEIQRRQCGERRSLAATASARAPWRRSVALTPVPQA